MQTVSFATAHKAKAADSFALIRETLARTRSYAATARQTGVPEITIREMMAPPAPRRTFTPPTPPEVSATPLTIREIIMLACVEEGLSYADILSDCRRRYLAWPRQRMMWLVRRAKPNASLPEIGRRFGGRDHSTVHHAIAIAQTRYVTHDDERIKLDALIAALEDVSAPRSAAAALDAEIKRTQARLADLRDRRRALTGSVLREAA